jgi:type VII secretion system (Wss) protein YukD
VRGTLTPRSLAACHWICKNVQGEGTMRTVLVTIENTSGSVDLALPLDVPIMELLPPLVAACSPPQTGAFGVGGLSLALGTSDGGPFAAQRTLADCGVVDGMRLLLQEEDAWRRRASTVQTQLLPQDIPSSTQTGGIGIHWSRDI